MKITADTLSRAHLEHLQHTCRTSPAGERCVCADAALAIAGDREALEDCVVHWHEMFSEDVDALDVREKAALICQIAASNPDLADAYGSVCRDLGLERGDAFELALGAWCDAGSFDDWQDAEAEALIRTGRSP